MELIPIIAFLAIGGIFFALRSRGGYSRDNDNDRDDDSYDTNSNDDGGSDDSSSDD